MIQKATLSEPLDLQPGDSVAVVGGVLTVTRDGHAIRTINLNPISEQFTGFVPFGNQHSINAIFWEKRMPGVMGTLVSVHKATSGTVTFNFSDGSGRAIDSWADAAEIANKYDAGDTFWQEALIAKSYRNSPDGTNMETMVGASFSADLAATQPFNFTSEG